MIVPGDLLEYFHDAERFWPKTHSRNAIKLNRFLERGAKTKNEAGIRRYIENVIHIADLRQQFNVKHFYLVNPGSSGSHWVEAMLGFVSGFHNGGEVYLPGPVIQRLKEVDFESAKVFVDALYLIHSGGVYKDSLTCAVSNSAHLAFHDKMSRFSDEKVTALLVRNPVDVVLSRTFRKSEYKNDVAHRLDDREYLESNCNYVEKFFEGVAGSEFDIVVRYEDFLSNPKKRLEYIVEALGLECREEEMDLAVKKTSKNEIRKTISSGSKPATNLYLDKVKEEGWAKGYVKERLSWVMEKYGY